MKLKESNSLREVLRVLVRSLGALEKNQACCSNTTLSQCHAIIEVGRSKELTLNELAEILMLDKSTMSRTINNLVDANLVTREIHPNDRRYITIKLTQEGEKTYKNIEDNMINYFNNVLNLIPEEKREIVIESLEIVVKALMDNKSC